MSYAWLTKFHLTEAPLRFKAYVTVFGKITHLLSTHSGESVFQTPNMNPPPAPHPKEPEQAHARRENRTKTLCCITYRIKRELFPCVQRCGSLQPFVDGPPHDRSIGGAGARSDLLSVEARELHLFSSWGEGCLNVFAIMISFTSHDKNVYHLVRIHILNMKIRH